MGPPRERASISAASWAEAGLPMTRSSTVTSVSVPRTNAPGATSAGKTAPRTLARAFFSARTDAGPPSSTSSAAEGTTVNGTPRSRSSECRRGDCDARISWKSAGKGGLDPHGGTASRSGTSSPPSGKKMAISRSALARLSALWTTFRRMSSPKSPRTVPGAASSGFVAPIMPRTTFTAEGPSTTMAKIGAEVMWSTRSS